MEPTADALHTILSERGPLDHQDLVAAMAVAGMTLSVADVDELLHDDELTTVACLLDGRHAVLEALLGGRTFTHRLTAREIAADCLVSVPDLEPLVQLLDADERFLMLAGRGAIRFGSDLPDQDPDLGDEDSHRLDEFANVDPDELLALPAGSLAGWRPGDVIGLRVGAADIDMVLVDGLASPPADLGGQIEAALHQVSGELEPIPLGDLMLQLCADDPGSFTDPISPLDELLPSVGYVVRDSLVAPEGFDIDSWATQSSAEEVARRHRLTMQDATIVAALAGIIRKLDARVGAALATPADPDADTETDTDADIEFGGGVSDGEPDDGDADDGDADDGDADDDPAAGSLSGAELDLIVELAAAMRDPDVAEAVFAESVGIAVRPAVSLGALAEEWEPRVPRASRVGLRWLRARCLERLGSTEAAEQELLAAVDLDPKWPPALTDLARFVADRGDADAALSLLRRAGVPRDDQQVELLQRYLSPARSGLGRNKPCWCGSGRKYKVCHLGREGLPLGVRAGWLYEKAAAFAQEGPYREQIIELAVIRAQHETKPLAMLNALHDPLVLDATLFEEGAFASFLEVRGVLLPADEQLLAAQWLTVSRSVFEVETIQPRKGFTVRDVRTGERIEVSEKAASTVLKPGNRIVARIVPIDDTGQTSWQIFGGIEPLPLWQYEPVIGLLDALDAGDAAAPDLVEFLTARFAQPTLTTTDGEPMVSCVARFEILDAQAMVAALDGRYGDEDDDDGSAADEGNWTWTDSVGTFPTVLGSLAVDGTELRVEAMNEKRFATLLADVATVPGVRMLGQQRTPAAELMAARGSEAPSSGARPGGAQPAISPTDDPDVMAAVQEWVLDYERSWLDTALPALGGITPRQAADDPTRRGDLLHLLDTFDDMAGRPGTMQPDRIRAELDL